jgi:hypothetical protein
MSSCAQEAQLWNEAYYGDEMLLDVFRGHTAIFFQ